MHSSYRTENTTLKHTGAGGVPPPNPNSIELRPGSSFRKEPGVDDGCTIMFIPQLEQETIRLSLDSLSLSPGEVTKREGERQRIAIIHPKMFSRAFLGGMAPRAEFTSHKKCHRQPTRRLISRSRPSHKHSWIPSSPVFSLSF